MSAQENTALSIADPAPSQGDGQLQVSTRFMEQYEIVRPVNGGTELVPFANFNGNVDVYSVSINNRVFRIRQQTDSKAGWIDTDLGIDATQLSLHAFAGATLDTPAIFGLNAARQLTLSQFDGVTYRQKVSQPPDATAKLKQFRAAQSVLGNIHANVILDTDEVATSFVKPDGVWQSRNWVPMKAKQGGTENAKVRQIAMCENNPVQTSLYAIGMANEVLFSDASFRFSYFVQLGTLQAIDITVVEDTENRLNIFAVDTSHHLWQKRQKKYSSGGGIEWDSWVQLDARVSLQSSRAVVNFNGGLDVFAIGEDGLLYHTRQLLDSANKPIGWSTLFPLGNPVPSSIFAVGRSGGGYAEAYSVTRDNQLYRFWQDPVTTQWYSGLIALQESGQMASVPAHSVELTVLDEAGYARAEVPVTIHTSTLVPLRIQGLYYIVSEFDGVTVNSAPDGKVMIERFTDTLTAPTFFVATPFMADGEGVTVEPNASLQDQMRLTTKDDVWNARGVDGEYLLKGDNRTPENAEAIAGIMQRSMSLGYPPPAANADRSLRYIGRNRSLTGLRHVRKGESPFRHGMQHVQEQHWHVDLSGGNIRVRDLQRHEVPMLLASAPLAAEGFLGIDWGDVWQSVKEGVGDIVGAVKEFIVTTIIDPITGLVDKIKVLFKLVIDQVEQWIDTVITAFQQAFDIIEGIWNKLKVFFEDLFKWLAFLFQWEDIRRTADAVEHSFNATLDFFILAMKDVRARVEAGFDAFEKNIKDGFDGYIASLSNQETTGTFISPEGRESPTLDAGSSHNPLLNGYMQNLKDGATLSLAAPRESNGPIEAIVAELEKLGNNFQFGEGKAAFDEALVYFQQAGSNPDNFFALVYKGLVKVIEGMTLIGVAIAKGVLLSLIDVVIDLIGYIKQLANEEWEIPFVSQLYQFITGEKLTFRPIRMLAYIVAIPTTIVYKIVDGNAPFPDDASVDAFRGEYTGEYLAQQAGILPKSKASKRAKNAMAVAGPRPVWSQIFGTAFGVLTIVMIPVDAAQAYFTFKSGGEEPTPAPKYLGWLFVGGRALWSIFSIPWAISQDAGGLGCKLGTKELNNTRWMCNAIGGPLRGFAILIVRDVFKVKVPPAVGEVTLAIWGLGNFIWCIFIAAGGSVWDGPQIAENIMLSLSSQVFRICPLKPVVEVTEGVSVGVLVAGLISYLAIAGIHFYETWKKPAEEADARLMRLGYLPA